MAEEKKMGRPTDNPKGRPIHVRLDAEADAILEAYCARENVTRAEAIRRGIYLLKNTRGVIPRPAAERSEYLSFPRTRGRVTALG